MACHCRNWSVAIEVFSDRPRKSTQRDFSTIYIDGSMVVIRVDVVVRVWVTVMVSVRVRVSKVLGNGYYGCRGYLIYY